MMSFVSRLTRSPYSDKLQPRHICRETFHKFGGMTSSETKTGADQEIMQQTQEETVAAVPAEEDVAEASDNSGQFAETKEEKSGEVEAGPAQAKADSSSESGVEKTLYEQGDWSRPCKIRRVFFEDAKVVKVRYAPAVAWRHVNLYVQPHCTPDHIKSFLKEAASFSESTCRVVGMESGEKYDRKGTCFYYRGEGSKTKAEPLLIVPSLG